MVTKKRIKRVKPIIILTIIGLIFFVIEIILIKDIILQSINTEHIKIFFTWDKVDYFLIDGYIYFFLLMPIMFSFLIPLSGISSLIYNDEDYRFEALLLLCIVIIALISLHVAKDAETIPKENIIWACLNGALTGTILGFIRIRSYDDDDDYNYKNDSIGKRIVECIKIFHFEHYNSRAKNGYMTRKIINISINTTIILFTILGIIVFIKGVIFMLLAACIFIGLFAGGFES